MLSLIVCAHGVRARVCARQEFKYQQISACEYCMQIIVSMNVQRPRAMSERTSALNGQRGEKARYDLLQHA